MSISYVQTEGNNVPMPCVQDMDISSAEPSTLQLIAIPYSTNQPTDLNLWDSTFSSTLIFRVNKFLSKENQNISYSLLKIGTFIQ